MAHALTGLAKQCSVGRIATAPSGTYRHGEQLAVRGAYDWFIDRRLNGKNKSTVNRQRFLRRYKSQIKQSISEAINKRSVTDVDSGESVSIPTDDISEPMFHQGRGGLRHRVHPGNDHFVQNDRIERPQGGGGGSGSGQGQPARW